MIPLVGVYGGYTRNEFDADNDGKVKDQGFNAGLRLAIPTPLIPVDPYVKAGAVFNTLEHSTNAGAIRAGVASDRSLGFEVGAGVGIGLGPKLSFTPQVTYTRYDAEFEDIGVEERVEHIRVDVGLRLRL
jgi:outer membrane autotransporter protein